MTPRERAFFAQVRQKVDYWSERVSACATGSGACDWSANPEAFAALHAILKTQGVEGSLRVVLHEFGIGLVHSVLAVIDGEGDSPPMILVEMDTRAEIGGGVLHGRFIEDLMDRQG